MHNPKRVFVAGQYVGMSHSIGIPGGCYITWEQALTKVAYRNVAVRHGHVYVITNPAWPEWCKIGRALEAHDRTRGFQTGSPYRDYELYGFVNFEDRYKVENEAHKMLAEAGFKQYGEWFLVTPLAALNLLKSIQECM